MAPLLLRVQTASTRTDAPRSPAVRGGLGRRPDLCLFDVAKLSHAWISDRTPGVDRFRCHWERARLSRIHLSELLHAKAVLERHAVGFHEVKQHHVEGCIPPRPNHDLNITFLHTILRSSRI